MDAPMDDRTRHRATISTHRHRTLHRQSSGASRHRGAATWSCCGEQAQQLSLKLRTLSVTCAFQEIGDAREPGWGCRPSRIRGLRVIS